ncbi:MAG: tetratricopeptide repeat protein [Treponema sp.]|jgi:tetratricopeptide (TPR) repeat protein|nr:tetratricopeptide repeat protein [Treponema sp.]
MKKFCLTALLIPALGVLLSAQLRSAHYEIIVPAGSADGPAYQAEMEQRFSRYSDVFRFDPALLPAPLRVRVFTSQGEYDAYVTGKLGGPRPGAVYLHYNNPAGRELVIHRGSPGEGAIVPHQAFIQYLRAFVPNPPSWLREGFAVYFTTLVWDRDRGTPGSQGTLAYEENLIWLETVKRQAINPETVFLADRGDASLPQMQALSWSLVSFLMADPGGPYHRSLTDGLMVLKNTAGAEENARAFYNRLSLFSPPADFIRDYNAYIAGKKTFVELVEEGQRAYGAKNLSEAEALFRRALEMKSGHHAPCYYLGLVAYENKNYTGAETFYKTALDLGAERGLVQYARGVNAAASGKTAEAVAFLEEAAAADSAKYKARCDDLIKKLRAN